MTKHDVSAETRCKVNEIVMRASMRMATLVAKGNDPGGCDDPVGEILAALQPELDAAYEAGRAKEKQRADTIQRHLHAFGHWHMNGKKTTWGQFDYVMETRKAADDVIDLAVRDESFAKLEALAAKAVSDES